MWHYPSNRRPDPPIRRWWTLLATALTTVLVTTATRLTAVSTERSAHPERGDVPGWVMVTLMTAGLVAIVWVLADDWLRQLFQQAVDRVSGP